MATGTTSHTPSPAFHTDDAEQTVEYRSLSVPAILALILGLASPLCFGAPLLLLIPLVGIAFAVFAIIRIDASDGALAGRWAAVLGLVLCSSLAVAPLARSYVLRTMRTSQAQTFATQWINNVIAGHTDEAYRLTIDAVRGPAPVEPGGKKPPDPREKFLELPQVKAMIAAGADAQIKLVDTVAYDPQAFERVFVGQRFNVVPAASQAGAPTADVLITMQRAKLPREGRSRWLIWSITDGAKPAASMPLP